MHVFFCAQSVRIQFGSHGVFSRRKFGDRYGAGTERNRPQHLAQHEPNFPLHMSQTKWVVCVCVGGGGVGGVKPPRYDITPKEMASCIKTFVILINEYMEKRFRFVDVGF